MSKKFWVALFPVFYRMFYVLLLTGVVIKGFGNYLGVRNLSGWHWLWAVIALLLLAWIDFGEIKGKMIGLVLLILCGTVVVPFAGVGKLEDFHANYFRWVIWGKDYVKDWITGYELMQVLWVVLGCYLFQVVSHKSRVVKELSALILLGLLILCMIKGIHIEQIGVALSLCYIFVCAIERIRYGWNKIKSLDNQGYIVWLVPFLALYVLLLSVMPYSEEAYDWAFAKRIYNNLHEKFLVWFENSSGEGNEDFGSFLSDFSEVGELEDNVSTDKKEIMYVSSNRSLLTNMYLPGKYYDTFRGGEWEQTVKGDTGEYPLDALETLYAVKRYDPEWMSNYIRTTGITLTYGHFNTGYIFLPLKSSYLNNTEYYIDGRDFKFGEQKGYGTTYNVSFYQMNLEGNSFIGLLETELEEDVEVWADVVASYAPKAKKSLTMQDLDNYRQRMKQAYSKEIVLSDQVEEYLEEITVECDTPYEKLKAIETALSDYTYTLNPGALPVSVDTPEEFLDYFLLESRQGFCTYFATAFTLLAQAEGYPARYVEGFCVSSDFASGNTSVYSDMAHAWPEVYLEGVGWIPFEPTPGYSALRYAGWIEEEPVTEPSATLEPDEKEEEIGLPVQENVFQEESPDTFRLLLVLKVICIVLPIVMFVAWLERVRQKRLYARMSTEQKFEVEIKRILWLFARLDCRRKENETLSELAVRIEEVLPELAKRKGKWCFIDEYEEYLYRTGQVTSMVLEKCISEREELLDWMKEERKGYYYLLRLWLFFSM